MMNKKNRKKQALIVAERDAKALTDLIDAAEFIRDVRPHLHALSEIGADHLPAEVIDEIGDRTSHLELRAVIAMGRLLPAMRLLAASNQAYLTDQFGKM